MRKLVECIFVGLLFFYYNNSCEAQTSVEIWYAYNQGYEFCSPPQEIDFGLYVFASGYTSGDTISASINFGDGTSKNFKHPLDSNIFQFSHTYTSSGYFSVRFIASAPDGKSDTVTNTDEVHIDNSCGTIQGQIFNDLNGDNQYDNNDLPISHTIVFATNQNGINYSSMTDADGIYYIQAPSEVSYDVKPSISFPYELTYPESGIYDSVIATIIDLDFAVKCKEGHDLAGSIYGSLFIPGSANSFIDAYTYDLSCDSLIGTLKVILDTNVYFNSASVPPSSISGDTLIWNSYHFPGLTYQYIPTIYISTPTKENAQLGDSVCFTIIAEPLSDDVDSENNVQTACYVIKESWDPNIKDVFPRGNISSQNELTYNIQFQNTGTASASNVYVLDTLDSNLDLTSFKFIGSSHICDVTFPGSNIVMFYFHNIYLPDSNSNEPQSHGWLSYSLKPKADVSIGSIISNSASIYFDFNDPVITNTVINTILTVGTQEIIKAENVNIYPNPVSDNLQIESPLLWRNISVLLFDIWGNEILSQHVNSGSLNLSVSNLQEGIYFLSILSEDGKVFKKIIVQR